MKKIGLSILVTISIAAAFSFGFVSKSESVDSAVDAKINWVSMEEAVEAAKKDGKKILVDLTTVWCGWCKRMDKDTYSNANIIKYVNEHYYAVKFDAEKTTRDITINGTTYKHLPNVGRNGVHEWAARMMNGRLSYPTTAILDSNSSIITNVPGYHKPGEMIVILSFLGEDHYKTTSWESYQAQYSSR